MNVAFIQRPAVINPDKSLILYLEKFYSLQNEEKADQKCSFSKKDLASSCSLHGGKIASSVVIISILLL